MSQRTIVCSIILTAVLLTCTNPVRDNPYDQKCVNCDETNTTTIKVVNYLVRPLNTWVNNSFLGQVPARQTVYFQPKGLDTLFFEYTVLNDSTSGGTPVGDTFSGYWPTKTLLSDTMEFAIDNILDQDTFFCPFITNTSANNLYMIVNYGTLLENKCDCYVPAGGDSIRLGYYRFTGATEIRGYEGSYTGVSGSWFASNFKSLVEPNSGKVVLTYTPGAGAPALSVNSASLAFGTATASLSFTISNTGAGTLTWSASSDRAWLTLLPASGSVTTGSTTVYASVSRLALAGGNYTATITVTSNGGTRTIPATMNVPVTIRVVNRLVANVLVWANGSLLGTVLAQDSGSYLRANIDTLFTEYEVARPKLTNGNEIGDTIVGSWATRKSLAQVERFEIDNILGTDTIFSPYITNASADDLYMIVNYGSALQNFCNCYVPALTVNQWLGYYWYRGTTEIRGYKNSYLSDTWVYWQAANFNGLILPNSGAVYLNHTPLSGPPEKAVRQAAAATGAAGAGK
jgi:hypothetical protein